MTYRLFFFFAIILSGKRAQFRPFQGQAVDKSISRALPIISDAQTFLQKKGEFHEAFPGVESQTPLRSQADDIDIVVSMQNEHFEDSVNFEQLERKRPYSWNW